MHSRTKFSFLGLFVLLFSVFGLSSAFAQLEIELSIGSVLGGSSQAIAVGKNFTYSIVVINSNTFDLPSVSVLDKLPAEVAVTGPISINDPQAVCQLYPNKAMSCNLSAMASNAMVTIDIPVRLMSPGVNNQVTNMAEAFANNEHPTDSKTFTTFVVGDTIKDVGITKTATPAVLLNPTDQVTYTLTVKAEDPAGGVVNDVIVEDNIPDQLSLVSVTVASGSASCNNADPVVCDLGDMPAGSEVVIKIVADASGFDNFPGCDKLINTAVVSSLEDSNSTNNQASAEIQVGSDCGPPSSPPPASPIPQPSSEPTPSPAPGGDNPTPTPPSGTPRPPSGGNQNPGDAPFQASLEGSGCSLSSVAHAAPTSLVSYSLWLGGVALFRAFRRRLQK